MTTIRNSITDWGVIVLCTATGKPADRVLLTGVCLFCPQQQENQQRQVRGEPPLPEEDINKLFKPLQPPPRLDCLLVANQIDQHCNSISEFSSQSIAKLLMAEALQENAGTSAAGSSS